MNYSIVVFVLLVAATLSSVFNVPVFANDFEVENEEGILNIGRNDCEQKQKDFEDAEDNSPTLNCNNSNDNFVDNERFGNIIGGEDGDNTPEPTLTCEECFAALDSGDIDIVLSALRATSLSELCEMLDTGEVNLAALEQILETRVPDFQADVIIECIVEALEIAI